MRLGRGGTVGRSQVCYFQQLPERPCLIVGTASNMTLHPRVAPKCTLKTFLYDDQSADDLQLRRNAW